MVSVRNTLKRWGKPVPFHEERHHCRRGGIGLRKRRCLPLRAKGPHHERLTGAGKGWNNADQGTCPEWRWRPVERVQRQSTKRGYGSAQSEWGRPFLLSEEDEDKQALPPCVGRARVCKKGDDPGLCCLLGHNAGRDVGVPGGVAQGLHRPRGKTGKEKCGSGSEKGEAEEDGRGRGEEIGWRKLGGGEIGWKGVGGNTRKNGRYLLRKLAVATPGGMG